MNDVDTLMDEVLDQIRKDVEAGYFSGIEEMLAFVPKDILKNYLEDL
jgi:hypothetical protein